MMKSIKIYMFLLITLSVFGCKNYLDTDPIDRYVYYNYLETEKQVEDVVVGCYRKAFPIANNYIWFYGDYMSDNSTFSYNPTDRGGLAGEQVDEFVATVDNGTFTGAYKESYEGVQRSNYALQGLKDVKYTSDSLKSIREGEALFFRAWHYFNLVRLYGDQPIIKSVITNVNEGSLGRQPVEQVYNELIVPDAQAAISKLPKTVPATQKGRLTKGAALMLLAKAYMAQKKYADAIPLLEEIKTLGYALNVKYADNFDPTKKNSIESIYEIQSDPSLSLSFGFGGSWTPWGTARGIWPNGAGSRGGLNQPTSDLEKAYEINDTIRKNVTIGRYGKAANDTVLYMKKFIIWDENLKGNPCNYPIYRYADALLMLAECQNQANFPNPQAFANLNAVRKRAGIADKTQGNANPALAINNQADFRLAIEKERQVELASEGHRWFDLVRTGKADEVMKAHGTREKALKTTVDRNAYTTIRLLLPLPLKEVQQFGYKQNPGW
jgi:starch-binding outer membrane protein, SusD/RagB family